jgi:hypothetical protein
MPWIDRLRLWSQDLYLACLADSGLPPAKNGTQTLRATVRGYTQFSPNALSPPSLRLHPTRATDSLVVRNRDYNGAKRRFSQRLARSLLLDLDVLQDETLREFVVAKGLNPVGGIESYVNQLGANLSDIEWARYRSVELSAVRNCITHNRQVWQQGQINRLSALNNQLYPLPKENDPINIEIAHLFAYKTAARHVLTRCQ